GRPCASSSCTAGTRPPADTARQLQDGTGGRVTVHAPSWPLSEHGPCWSLAPPVIEALRCLLSATPAARSAARKRSPPSSATAAANRPVPLTATADTRPGTPIRKRRRRSARRPMPQQPGWNQPGDSGLANWRSGFLEQLGVSEKLAQGVQVHRLRHVPVE